MKRIYLLIMAAVVLCGCAPWVRNDQLVEGADSYALDPSHSLGQTLTARHAGLRGVEIYLEPREPTQGQITLSLFTREPNPIEITTSRLEIRTVDRPGFYRFSFPSIAGSAGQSYLLKLEFDGSGGVAAPAGPGSGYLDGSLYVDGQPVDAQLAFRTLYNPAWLAAGVFRQGFVWLWVFALSLWLFLMPGLALLAGLFQKWDRLTKLETAILGAGLGLAVYPVLFLVADLVGLQPGMLLAWGPPSLAAFYLLWKARSMFRRPLPIFRGLRWRAEWIPEAAAVLASGLLLAGRFYPVAGLAAPMWGDSYQHSMITELMIDHGGLFDSWQPYADLTAFTYHFGFHSLAAVFGWVSGSTSWQAVLWSGQILNYFAVLTLYPLALRLSGSRWGGLIAVLVAGALSPMPMAYINWGRYTQLAGQAILPIAIYFAWLALEHVELDWRLISLGWIAWAGMALTHYRVLIFGVIFILAYLALRILRTDRKAVVRPLLVLSIGAGVLFLPWFVRIFAGRIIDMLVSQLTTPPNSASVWAQNNLFAFSDLDRYLPGFVWILAGLGFVWALARRNREQTLVGLWAGFVLLAANPDWIRLPGEGALSNFAIFIAAYIPAALLIGGAGGEILGKWVRGEVRSGLSVRSLLGGGEIENSMGLKAKSRAPEKMDIGLHEQGKANIAGTMIRNSILVAFLLLMVSGWGARERLKDVDPISGSLVTQPDVRAARWIEGNIPVDARFHVNQFFAFSDSVTVGSDAGWWLPLLARRATDLPPINYGFERTSRPDYREWVNALPALIQEKGIDSAEVLAAFDERGISHIYLGQRQGTVNYNGPHIIDPDRLLASPAFKPIYHQDRVWIFEITP